VFAFIFFALFLALFFSVLLVGVLGWRRPGHFEPGASISFLFLIFFFGLWAAAVWLQPVGPVLWGVAWMPILFAGLILGLIVLAATPRRPRISPPRPAIGNRPSSGAGERDAALGLGVFFWLLLFLVLLAAVLRTWT